MTIGRLGLITFGTANCFFAIDLLVACGPRRNGSQGNPSMGLCMVSRGSGHGAITVSLGVMD
jgi:hypothetical protein